MEHVFFRLATLLLIVVDVTLVIVNLFYDQEATHVHDGVEIASRVIISYFVLEIFLRIFYKG